MTDYEVRATLLAADVRLDGARRNPKLTDCDYQDYEAWRMCFSLMNNFMRNPARKLLIETIRQCALEVKPVSITETHECTKTK